MYVCMFNVIQPPPPPPPPPKKKKQYAARYSAVRLHFLTGLRSLGLRQSAAINIQPDCSGTLHRTLNADVPDPFFPDTHTKEKKKRSGYARLSNTGLDSLTISGYIYSMLLFRFYCNFAPIRNTV